MNKSRENFPHMCAWLLGVIVWFTAYPGPVIGQDAPPDQSVESGQEPAAQEGPENPEAAPAAEPKKRRFLKRIGPQQLTPEQQEEAERLRKLAAKFGTDPTAIVGRVQLSSAYYDFPDGVRATETVARVDLPFKGDYLLRVEAPFLRWSDPNLAGAPSESGFSDLLVTAGWRVYNKPEYAVLVGVVSSLPTAAETGLGLGKYTVGPTVATARVLPDWDTFLIGLFTQQFSVGGDPSRKDIDFSRFSLAMTTLWTGNWWSTAQTVLVTDWERKAKTGMTFELEVGRNVVGTWGVFARPGVGLFGQGVGGTYDWNIEAAIRRTFKSF